MDSDAVWMIIRHGVFNESAYLIYVGQSAEEVPNGDVVLPESSDDDQLAAMRASVTEALGYVRAVDGNVAALASRVNIAVVPPLPAPLAQRMVELDRMFNAESDAEWERFLVKLTRPKSDLDWQALMALTRIYEGQWMADFKGGNPELQRQSGRILHQVLLALLHKFDGGSRFSREALPIMVNISLALLNARESQIFDDNMERCLQNQDSPEELEKIPRLQFGGFAFAYEPGYHDLERAVLNEQIYLSARDTYLAPEYSSPGGAPSQTLFLYINTGTQGIQGWMGAKPSGGRQTIWISEGMAEVLIRNPLALAEMFAEEVGAHIIGTRPVMSVQDEEKVGLQLRDQVFQKYKQTYAGKDALLRLKDLMEEEIMRRFNQKLP